MTDYKIVHDGFEYNVFIYESNPFGMVPANSVVYSGEHLDTWEFSADTTLYSGHCHPEIIIQEMLKFSHELSPEFFVQFWNDHDCNCNDEIEED